MQTWPCAHLTHTSHWEHHSHCLQLSPTATNCQVVDTDDEEEMDDDDYYKVCASVSCDDVHDALDLSYMMCMT